jgi:probable addiction module antidote protein
MPKRTGDFDSWRLEKLSDPVNAAHYLNAALEDSPDVFLDAFKDVIQARKQVSKIAKEAGVARESLYRSFSASGNPTLDMLYSVLKALELDLKVEANARQAPATNPPQMSKSRGSRKRGRGRVARGVSQQQLTLFYDQNPITSVPSVQGTSSFKGPEQRNTGATGINIVGVNLDEVGFMPGFYAHISQNQSYVLTPTV